ncbi:MAG: hypothetical protein PHC41_00920 [Lachnospiraceae bacterium]|nr:hypothetical protein [Lachnospiraceae bacterium]MDD3614767.1 hypothetical protein [Lachnospiraceae bacterium]
MLHTWMEWKVLLYALVGIGVVSFLAMIVEKRFWMKNWRSWTKMDWAMNKQKMIAMTGGLLCVGVTTLAVFTAYYYKYSRETIYQYLKVGGGLLLAIYLGRLFLGMASREQVLGEFLMKQMTEKPARTRPERPPKIISLKKEEDPKKEVVEQVIKKIKENQPETTSYSKYLTKEEEGIMREVIHEYMT